MIEVTGDLWTYPADIRVITTNGFVKSNGVAVMGRGCAKEASIKYPGFPRALGTRIRQDGNKVHIFYEFDSIVTFPVKHVWYQDADLDLILKSTQEIVALAGIYPHTTRFVIPRPGCGNGGRKWSDVKPILESVSGFDERFHVITYR